MDEKKVREEYLEFPWGIADTIENLRVLKSILQRQVEKADCDGKGAQDALEVKFDFDRAIEALEKQLPKKPIIKSEKEVPHTHNLGRLLRFHCPNCGRFIVGIYEMDVERGGGISNRLKGCSTCLQAIDFSEYYSNAHKDKLSEEIQWDD